MLFKKFIRNQIGDTEHPAHLKVVASLLAAILLAAGFVGVMNFLSLFEGPPPGRNPLRVILTPILPVTNSSIKAIIALPNSETNYDTITYSYHWYKNAVLQPALTTDTVDASYVSKGDTWRCEVSPASSHEAELAASAEITILNSPPTTPKVAVVADGPSGASDLACYVTTPSSDPDNDPVTYSYEWHKNGKAQPGLNTNVVHYSYTAASEMWKCVVSVNDGAGGIVRASDEVTITKGVVLPSSSSDDLMVNLTPGIATANEKLVASVTKTADAGSSQLSYTYEWYKNGVPQPELSTDTVDSSQVSSRDTWRVLVTASDGATTTTAIDEVTISSDVSALYVWSANYRIVRDTSERASFFTCCQKNKINTVWIALDADSLRWFDSGAGYPVEEYTSFIQQANDRGIAIHGMLSSAGGTVLNSRASHKEYVLAVLRYNQQHPDAKFAGMHFDIENVDTGWSVSTFLDAYTSYIRDLKTWQYNGQTVKSQGLVMSLYCDQVPEAGGSSLSQWLNWVGEFDLVEIQAYSDTTDSIITTEEAYHNPGRAALLNQQGIPFIILSEIDDLGSSRDRITFWEEGLAYYYNVRVELYNHYKQFSTFKGFGLHHYQSLVLL